MKKSMQWGLSFQAVTLVIFAFGLLSGCNKDDKPKPKNSSQPQAESLFEPPADEGVIQIVNSAGLAIENAQVLIGPAQGQPFEGNFLASDSTGQIKIPKMWSQPEMLTIDAPGYLRVTYLGLFPESKTIVLTQKFVAASELRGKTSGHPVKNKDGIVDFSLVMAGMTKQDLLNFQIEKVISPVSDTISAVGQEIQIPANVSLPNQTEKKLFFDVNLNKPVYRLFFPDAGVKRVFVARGRFPFDEVVDGFMDKKQIFELINFFTITGGTLRDVDVKGPLTNLDIPATELTFKEKKAFQAPALANDQVLVAVAASDNNGYLIPTDIKRLGSGEKSQLSIWPEFPLYLAQIIKKKSEFEFHQPGIDRLSATISTFDSEVRAQPLPLIGNPSAKGRFQYQVPAVNSSELNQLVTYGVISDVKVTEKDGVKMKTATKVWEIYAPAWVTEIKLPSWEWNKSEKLTRFEVSIVGSVSQEKIPLGPLMMEKATHVTRSSIDF